jgi:hypothetical protein
MVEAVQTSENMGKFIPVYAALQPRRQPSSRLLWLNADCVISLFLNCGAQLLFSIPRTQTLERNLILEIFMRYYNKNVVFLWFLCHFKAYK